MAVLTRQNCSLPGDITVTPIYSGFMLGRALPERGPGPWWEYIKVVREFDAAVREARALAQAANMFAWFHEGGDVYKPIPFDDSPDPR